MVCVCGVKLVRAGTERKGTEQTRYEKNGTRLEQFIRFSSVLNSQSTERKRALLMPPIVIILVITTPPRVHSVAKFA